MTSDTPGLDRSLIADGVSSSPSIIRLSWVLCLVVLLISALALSWEPIRNDGWYIWWANRQTPLTPRTLWNIAIDNYLNGNPRMGQTVTFALYTPGPWHVLGSLAALWLTVWSLATIGLARSPRRADALYIATLLAMLFVAVPQAGPMFFYRPFLGNYVIGALPAFVLLAMYRVQLARQAPSSSRYRSMLLALSAVMLGVLGGMGNEHTGPAFIALIGLALYAARRQRVLQIWMIAGAVGFVFGFLLLFFAPGQQARYDGIGKVGVLATLIARPIAHSLLIMGVAPALSVLLLPWFAITKRRQHSSIVTTLEPGGTPRRWCSIMRTEPARSFIIALIAAIVIGGTLLASPKTGGRLYFAAGSLLCCTAAAWVNHQLELRQLRRLLWLNTAVLLLAGASVLRVTIADRADFSHRMQLLLSAPSNSDVVVPRIPNGFQQWSLGDDFRNSNLRRNIASRLGIHDIVLGPPL